MSSMKTDVPMCRAESKLRESIERLKASKTLYVPVGTRVSQNAVAKEAGVMPSSLPPSCFPALCLEISEWIDQHKEVHSQAHQKTAEEAINAINQN